MRHRPGPTTLACVVLLALVTSCTTADTPTTAQSPTAPPSSSSADRARASAPATSERDAATSEPVEDLCAEFPPRMPQEDNLEGWWNGTPADEDGHVQHDPAQWPDVLREHPAVAVLDGDTGSVASTWDRRTCGPLADFVSPVAPDSSTAGTWVVVDALTGEVLGTAVKMPR